MQVDVGVADAVVRLCNLHVGASLKSIRLSQSVCHEIEIHSLSVCLPLSLPSLIISHQLIPHFVIPTSFLVDAFLGGS